MTSDLADLRWRKSSYSGPEGDNCVEVASAWSAGMVAVRDSKIGSGAMLTLMPAEWSAFLSGIKTGTFPV
ncbi:DUF397 domain-containing protein [Sphaerisporangium sp. NPDC005289]|uniref:DUF397 domain-containing protein n=1 Tax=Sphaerisporangium sp. NPDC005289 TaxID=3155247 RepID=UPI0033B5EDE6